MKRLRVTWSSRITVYNSPCNKKKLPLYVRSRVKMWKGLLLGQCKIYEPLLTRGFKRVVCNIQYSDSSTFQAITFIIQFKYYSDFQCSFWMQTIVNIIWNDMLDMNWTTNKIKLNPFVNKKKRIIEWKPNPPCPLIKICIQPMFVKRINLQCFLNKPKHIKVSGIDLCATG